MRASYYVVGALLVARSLIGCVGDPPSSGSDDGGSASDATANDSSVASDAGAGNEGGAAISCDAAPPTLFPPVPDAGPFCKGVPGSHCLNGESCCINTSTNARSCAASCDPSGISLQCYSTAECGGGKKCCGVGTVDTAACPFPVAGSYKGTECATTCPTGDFVECASTADCTSGQTCTAGYPLDPTQSSPSTLQIGICLP